MKKSLKTLPSAMTLLQCPKRKRTFYKDWSTEISTRTSRILSIPRAATSCCQSKKISHLYLIESV